MKSNSSMSQLLFLFQNCIVARYFSKTYEVWNLPWYNQSWNSNILKSNCLVSHQLFFWFQKCMVAKYFKKKKVWESCKIFANVEFQILCLPLFWILQKRSLMWRECDTLQTVTHHGSWSGFLYYYMATHHPPSKEHPYLPPEDALSSSMGWALSTINNTQCYEKSYINNSAMKMWITRTKKQDKI